MSRCLPKGNKEVDYLRASREKWGDPMSNSLRPRCNPSVQKALVQTGKRSENGIVQPLVVQFGELDQNGMLQTVFMQSGFGEYFLFKLSGSHLQILRTTEAKEEQDF